MRQLLSGNEAIAHAVAVAGVGVATAYPGTPSTEILESIVKQSPTLDATWCINEKNAYEVAYGAAVAGARAFTAMKHVGLNVAADPLMTSAYTGTEKGFVIAVADDPGMFSSQNEQDTRNFAAFAKIPLLEPADSQEAFDFTVKAFEISETFDTPVILRISTRIAHTKTVVTFDENALAPSNAFTFKKNPQKYVMIPAFARTRHATMVERAPDVAAYANTTPLNRVEGKGKKGVLCAGVDYQYVKEALPEMKVLKLGMSSPFPEKAVKKFAKSVDTLYVIESLDRYMEDRVRALGIDAKKRLHPETGEITVDVLSVYTGSKKKNKKATAIRNLPLRPPSLCKGCSHRAVFETLRDMDVLVTGDIGCYTLGTLPPFSAMDTCLCMGASVGMASGFERVKALSGSTQPVVGVIGDSTFYHSGITGLVDAVYNRTSITLIILDNYVTAMTGHQPNPTTGLSAKETPAPRIDFETLVRGLGVEHVRRFNPFKEKEIASIIKEEVERKEVSVIIAEAPCIFYKRRFKDAGGRA